jgi:hypothetical protein
MQNELGPLVHRVALFLVLHELLCVPKRNPIVLASFVAESHYNQWN